MTRLVGIHICFSLILLGLVGCGHGSNSSTVPAPAPVGLSKLNPSDPNANAEVVSRIITLEGLGERPEEVQLAVKTPYNYGFDMPIKNNAKINYFYGARIWSSLVMSLKLEAGRIASPAVLIHSSENPQELLLNPASHHHWEFHPGVDIQAKEGTAIYAPADGVVFSAGNRACVGQTVVLRHEIKETQNVVYSIYNHLKPGSFETIKAGDILKRGTPFAKVGHSGGGGNCIEGSHLHFEIRTPIHGELTAESIENWAVFLQDTAKQNPADYVKEIDLACQARKNVEIANALEVAKREPGAVAPLSAGRCSFKYESHLSTILPIYRVFEKDQIRALGLR